MSVTKRKTILFGHYLLARGLISREDVSRALRLQKEQNRETEQVVRRAGLLSDEQIKDIRGFREGHLYFGEALVELGSMTGDAVHEHLEKFRKKHQGSDASGQ
jgi:hypothetical protein